jgi:cell division transport system permease protein
MKQIKPLLSFVMPLMAILIPFFMYLTVIKIVDNYNENVASYKIIIISKKPLEKFDEIANVGVKSIESISREDIINNIKNKLSDSAVDVLNSSLPYFSKINLNIFPTSKKLDQIKQQLMSDINVTQVETFVSNHNKIYSLLILTKDIVMTLFVVVLISSFVGVLKQIQIFYYEHSERISILQLHGASLFYGFKPILKFIIFSTIIAIVLMLIFIFLSLSSVSLFLHSEIATLAPSMSSFGIEILLIILLAIVIPLLAFFGLLAKYRYLR